MAKRVSDRLLPPKRIRVEVVEALRAFYTEHDRADLDEAIRLLYGYYEVTKPKIRWKKKILNGHALGLTHDDGVIELIHPRVWKRRKVENTEDEWVSVFLHESHHFCFWAKDCEARADAFAERMMREC